jgi:GT2 family glycosyltransferase
VPPAAIIIPTQDRAAYLDVALRSVLPQARQHDVSVIVVDDGSTDGTAGTAERHGARVVRHATGRGLNAARNSGIDAAPEADLLLFLDDDVEVRDGWLAAMLDAHAALPADYGVLTGPIHARFEDHRFRVCGREGAPITTTDHGPQDRDVHHAWGANMTVRRSAVERAGRFDEARHLYGDEQEWQQRVKAAGLKLRYVAAAALDHRRAGEDSRLTHLARAAYRRGRASRRFDGFKGTQPAPAQELRTLAATLVHGPRFACMNGPVMAAHSAGRVRELLGEPLRATAPPAVGPGEPDFLSGASGTVGGLRGRALRAEDALLDLRSARLRSALRRRAAADPPQRVVVASIVRDDVPGHWPQAAAELRRSHHQTTLLTDAPRGRGKFEALQDLLDRTDLTTADALLVCDDDVLLPRGLLDVLLHLATRHDLQLAQPAQRRHSHAAWPVTVRDPDPSTVLRLTSFVEIGPVTLFRREAIDHLLPFPTTDLRMGWGLDVHWAAVARDLGWRIGVVDAVPVAHTLRPVAGTYDRTPAVEEARRFLANRPYVRRADVRTLERLQA